jgi:hypothetical protein
LDLETCVAKALYHDGIVVSLGSVGNAPGPGRIEVADNRWKATVKLLGPFASAFFVLPSFNPGTTWEVLWLKKNGRLEDSIFIMPPEPRSSFSGRMELDMTDYWYGTRHHLEHIIKLPEYDPKGMFIWFTNSGAIRGTRQIKRRLSDFRRVLPAR